MSGTEIGLLMALTSLVSAGAGAAGRQMLGVVTPKQCRLNHTLIDQKLEHLATREDLYQMKNQILREIKENGRST